jgi:membrane protease YdiL (CAAX protease family)
VPLQRIPTYLGSIGFLTLLGSTSWLVGTRSGGAASLGLVALPPMAWTAWSAGLVLAGMGVIYLFRGIEARLGGAESVVLRDLLPRSGAERGLFAVLSTAAGLGEELAYRGYAIPVLAPIVGVGPSSAITSVVFGVLHGYQGTLGMIRASVIGGILAFGFLASGSLWPSIIAHAAIDVLAGIVLGERLLLQSEV